jgi:hypothetical protein
MVGKGTGVGLLFFCIAPGAIDAQTIGLLSSGSGSITLGKLIPYNPATGANGPGSMYEGTPIGVLNDEVLQAAINFVNATYFASGDAPVAASVTLTIPQGAFYLEPYLGNPSTPLDYVISSTSMTTTVDLPYLPTTPLRGTFPPAGVIDISSYDKETGPGKTAPLSNLVATIPGGSTHGNLTIRGAGDCVYALAPGGPAIGPLGCPSGTALYTEDGYVAVFGDQPNHVTFESLGFARPSEYVSQGTITATHTATLTGSGVYTPASVVVQVDTGYPGADVIYGHSEQTILYSNPDTHVSRYMRAYQPPSGTTPAILVTNTMNGAVNGQVDWAEPIAMQPGSGQTVNCSGSTPPLYTPSVSGTQQLNGTVLSACQVAPSCTPANSISSSCTIYLDHDGAVGRYSDGDYVCLKAKWLASEAYILEGPFADSSTPSVYGGTDVTFNGVSWIQQTTGSSTDGFTNLSILKSYALRGQTPQTTGSPLPCLASPSGGPQLSAHSPEAYGTMWPAGTDTVNGLYAIGLGDDAIAVFASDMNSTTTNIENTTLIDSFSHGLFISAAGTFIGPGANILPDWTTVGSTTIVSTIGSVTLTRSSYCIEGVPGQPVSGEDCVALSAWTADQVEPSKQLHQPNAKPHSASQHRHHYAPRRAQTENPDYKTRRS